MASESRTRRLGALLVAVAIALSLASPAAAEPTSAQKETARNLMQIGDGRYASGDYEAALRAYQGADEIMGVPTTALAVGRAQPAPLRRRVPLRVGMWWHLPRLRSGALERPNGTCTFIPNNQDPQNECLLSCNGNGACPLL